MPGPREIGSVCVGYSQFRRHPPTSCPVAALISRATRGSSEVTHRQRRLSRGRAVPARACGRQFMIAWSLWHRPRTRFPRVRSSSGPAQVLAAGALAVRAGCTTGEGRAVDPSDDTTRCLCRGGGSGPPTYVRPESQTPCEVGFSRRSSLEAGAADLATDSRALTRTSRPRGFGQGVVERPCLVARSRVRGMGAMLAGAAKNVAGRSVRTAVGRQHAAASDLSRSSVTTALPHNRSRDVGRIGRGHRGRFAPGPRPAPETVWPTAQCLRRGIKSGDVSHGRLVSLLRCILGIRQGAPNCRAADPSSLCF